MRERLIAALVGMTILMLTLYGLPRAYMLAELVTNYEERKIERASELIAATVTEREKTGDPIDAAYLESFLSVSETIEYVPAAGEPILVGPAVDESDDIIEPQTLSSGSTLTLSRSRDLIEERISDALVPLILIGLSLTLVAAGFGYVLARRLARPFLELAEAADRLGLGKFDIDPPHYPIPEAEAVGDALRSSARQLGDLVQREREFAANASHQLRTPITALRLQLEDLALWPQTPPEIAEELQNYLPELDRLSSAITEMLGLARGRRLGEAVETDLNELVADVIERWRPMVEGNGHELRHVDHGSVPARVIPGPVVQILDVLIDNASNYGTSPVCVEARHLGNYVQITVADAGRRTFGNEVFRRGESQKDGAEGGLGLTIAHELATSMGGYLSLADSEQTRFELLLPGDGVAEPR